MYNLLWITDFFACQSKHAMDLTGLFLTLAYFRFAAGFIMLVTWQDGVFIKKNVRSL